MPLIGRPVAAKPMRLTGLVALALGAAALAGCSREGGASDICTPFAAAAANGGPAVINDPAAAFDDCLHRWSYSLAGAKDQADVVASAAVAACGATLTRWNQQSLNQNSQSEPPDGASPTSLITGQPADLVTARAQFAQSRALFYVVQARAGSCAVPTGKPAAGEP